MKPKYIEFYGKHPAAKKEDRKPLKQPDSGWNSYGVSYSREFLKLDCDDYSHKTDELENIVNGRPASDVVKDILDSLGIKYNGIATEHGKHFFFRRPERLEERNKQKWVCPIGIELV